VFNFRIAPIQCLIKQHCVRTNMEDSKIVGNQWRIFFPPCCNWIFQVENSNISNIQGIIEIRIDACYLLIKNARLGCLFPSKLQKLVMYGKRGKNQGITQRDAFHYSCFITKRTLSLLLTFSNFLLLHCQQFNNKIYLQKCTTSKLDHYRLNYELTKLFS